MIKILKLTLLFTTFAVVIAACSAPAASSVSDVTSGNTTPPPSGGGGVNPPVTPPAELPPASVEKLSSTGWKGQGSDGRYVAIYFKIHQYNHLELTFGFGQDFNLSRAIDQAYMTAGANSVVLSPPTRASLNYQGSTYLIEFSSDLKTATLTMSGSSPIQMTRN